MNNIPEVLIIKKIIQKELLNELCNNNLIDLVNVTSIVKRLDDDISKLKKIDNDNKDMKKIVVKILV